MIQSSIDGHCVFALDVFLQISKMQTGQIPGKHFSSYSLGVWCTFVLCAVIKTKLHQSNLCSVQFFVC